MRRRKFLGVLCSAAAPWPVLVLAQANQPPVVIGWLHSDPREVGAANLIAFKDGLAALGWQERVRYVIEERWANGRADRLQPLAEELASKKPAVIVAALSRAVPAAAKAAPKTPIVFISGDPLAGGLAKSLARPGGLVTGLSTFTPNVAEKHVELLLAAAPKVKRVGILGDSNSTVVSAVVEAARRAAAQHNIAARFAEVANAQDIEPVLSHLAKDGSQGLIIAGGPLVRSERSRVIKLAMAQRWPVVSGQGGWAENGGLISYSADVLADYRRAAYYVDRIVKGMNPGELPIEQPTKFELVINLKTAKALGLAIPPSLLISADKVIE